MSDGRPPNADVIGGGDAAAPPATRDARSALTSDPASDAAANPIPAQQARTAEAGFAIATFSLSHRYPKSPRPALDQVTLSIAPGEIFAVLGPNGGGKTTLFRLLTTMLAPQRGQGDARVFGHDIAAAPAAVRRQLGVVFQNPSLDGKLTAWENLLHQGRLYGLGGADLRQRIDNWLTRFELADRRDDYVDSFSGGMRRRLELAKAMLHEPRLLLLDEPTTGLDPGARRAVWRHLAELRRALGLTVVLTTHLMDEAERCDRLAILSRGKLVTVDTPGRLKTMIGGDVVTVAPQPTADNSPAELARAIAQRFGPWPDDAGPRAVDEVVRFQARGREGLVDALRTALPGRIRSVTVGQPTLEDVFLHLTGHTFWHGQGQ